MSKETNLEIARLIANAYSTGDFEPLFPLMTDNYEHHSYWVWDPMAGKETVIPYYRGKGNALKKSPFKVKTELVRITEPELNLDPAELLYVNGEKMEPGTRITVRSEMDSICVLMHQTLDDGTENSILAVPTINEQGQLTQLLITNPDLFSLERIQEREDAKGV